MQQDKCDDEVPIQSFHKSRTKPLSLDLPGNTKGYYRNMCDVSSVHLATWLLDSSNNEIYNLWIHLSVKLLYLCMSVEWTITI